MARTLTFKLGRLELPLEVAKVDRRKLYGWVERRVLDGRGRECFLGWLSADGRHLFGRESFELGHLSPGGEWVERADLTVVDDQGHPVPQIESSFSRPITLGETVSIDEYLLHYPKSVYELTGEGLAELLHQVEHSDRVYSFPFNYVASYDPDVGFLIENEGRLFLVAGIRGEFAFIGREQSEAPGGDTDEAAGEEELFDFATMM